MRRVPSRLHPRSRSKLGSRSGTCAEVPAGGKQKAEPADVERGDRGWLVGEAGVDDHTDNKHSLLPLSLSRPAAGPAVGLASTQLASSDRTILPTRSRLAPSVWPLKELHLAAEQHALTPAHRLSANRDTPGQPLVRAATGCRPTPSSFVPAAAELRRSRRDCPFTRPGTTCELRPTTNTLCNTPAERSSSRYCDSAATVRLDVRANVRLAFGSELPMRPSCPGVRLGNANRRSAWKLRPATRTALDDRGRGRRRELPPARRPSKVSSPDSLEEADGKTSMRVGELVAITQAGADIV